MSFELQELQETKDDIFKNSEGCIKFLFQNLNPALDSKGLHYSNNAPLKRDPCTAQGDTSPQARFQHQASQWKPRTVFTDR